MQGLQSRRPSRAAGEPRAVGGRPDGPDVNRDRLIFCIASLVGHRVTATLRGNVMYEGLFHSCSLDGDFSITLKCARRLPSEANNRSGEIVHTLVVPGKDFLQVVALNVAPPCTTDETGNAGSRKGFATDGDIATRRDGDASRELVPWQADSSASGGGLEDGAVHDRKWDQFTANEKMYGVSSTFSEDLYTTKLDRNAIPIEKREQAERIAREIESGTMNSEIEDKLDGEGDDEEARFSSVDRGAGQKDAKALARNAPLPQVPERRDLSGHGQDALANMSQDRNRRGMIQEMKRINALNLEPTSSKHDDSSSRNRIGLKDQQVRNASRMASSADLKTEFQQSLDIITRQEASKQKRAQGGEGDPAWQGQNQQAMMMQRKPDGMQQAVGGYPKSAADQARAQQKSSFSFNPAAKAFSLNPQAGEFTPSHSGSGGTPVAKAPAHSPSFNVYKKGPETQRKGLTEILEPFFLRARGSTPDSAAPDWPDAKGPSYHEVLGQPNPSSRPLMAPQGCGGQGHMQTMGGGWQPQGQQMMQQVQQPGQQPQQGHQVQQQQGPGDQQGPPMAGMGGVGGPQMMQQGFVVSNGPPGGPPQQMYGNMYGPGGCQGHQGQGMPPNMMVLPGGQTMMAQGGQQMVPMGMVAGGQGGQNPNMVGGMAPMPKFGGNQQQMVVMPVLMSGPGQYQQTAFMPQTMQGGQMPGPQGPPGGPPQGDGGQGMMQQQPGMYPRQVGAG